MFQRSSCKGSVEVYKKSSVALVIRTTGIAINQTGMYKSSGLFTIGLSEYEILLFCLMGTAPALFLYKYEIFWYIHQQLHQAGNCLLINFKHPQKGDIKFPHRLFAKYNPFPGSPNCRFSKGNSSEVCRVPNMKSHNASLDP